MLLSLVKKAFLKNEKKQITRVFTYYIPAPPARKVGYREKEFDQVINYICDHGHKLLDITTAPHSQDERAGVWAICRFQTLTEDAKQFNFDFEYRDIASEVQGTIQMDPLIIHDDSAHE